MVLNRKVIFLLFFVVFLLNSSVLAQTYNFNLIGVQVEEKGDNSVNVGIFLTPAGSPKFNIQQKGTQLIVTFLNTQVKMQSKSVDVYKGFISNIELKQDKSNAIVTINFAGSIPKYSYTTAAGKVTLSFASSASASVSTQGKESVSIQGKEEVSLLSINIDKNYKPNLVVLNFSGTAPIYKSFILKDPLRFVIDLEKTTNKITEKTININSSPILSVRVSQFSKSPLLTRVVVDLKTTYPQIIAKDAGNKIYIGTSEVLAKVVPASEKVVKETIVPVETKPISQVPQQEKQEEKLEPSKPAEVKDKFQQRISVSFDRAEIRDVLKAMGQLAGLNIITDIGVQGRISVYLKDIPFRDAFYSLLAASDLGYIQQGEVIIVANLDKLQKIEGRDLVTKVYQLKYFESQKAKDVLSKTLKTAIVDSDDTRNWLIVSAPPSELPKIEDTIKTLDIPSEKVVETKGTGKVYLEKQEDTYLVTLTARGEDIKEILQEIAQKSGKNIIFAKNVSGGVYLTLNKVPLDKAIDLIIRSTECTYEIREGGFILVSAAKSEGLTPIVEIKELIKIEKIGDIYYITAELKKSDIKDVLQEIAEKTELNFVIDPKVTGDVELFVNKVPLDEVLTILQRVCNFDMEKIGQSYFIRLKETQVGTVTQLINTRIYALKYVTLQDLLRVGGSLVKNLSLSYDDKTGLLIAQGKEEDLKVLDDLVSRIDVERKGEQIAAKELLNVEREGDKIYISCDLKKADIREVLRELGKKADINFVIDQKVVGEVDLYLSRVELSEMLNILQKIANIVITREDKVTYVRVPEQKVQVPVEVAKTKIYALRYITLGDIERVGGSLVKNLSLSYDDKTGLLIAQGKEEDLKVLDDLISRIDIERKGEEQIAAKELLNVEREGEKIYISCDLRKADIREVLRELGKKADINFVIDQKVVGEVDLYLSRVELSEMLNILGKAANISFEKTGAVTFVRPIVSTVATSGQTQVVRELRLKYTSLDTLKSVVSGLAKDVSFYYDQTTGLLLVQGPADQIAVVEDMIGKIDKPIPQVKVDVNVIEVTKGKEKDLGIDWSSGTGSIGTGIKISATSGWQSLQIGIVPTEVEIPAQIKLLETQENAKILAQPSMTTISGKVTRIMIGDRVPIISYDASGNKSVTYVDAGIILEVTPIVNADGTITADIKPQVSTISGYKQDVPQISTREAQTIVTLKDGETLALGGLIREEDIESVTKVPILGDIPILGELFKARKTQQTQKELIILITPKILK